MYWPVDVVGPCRCSCCLTDDGSRTAPSLHFSISYLSPWQIISRPRTAINWQLVKLTVPYMQQ